MNAQPASKLSLIERAAQIYDFDAFLHGRGEDPVPSSGEESAVAADAPPAKLPEARPLPRADARTSGAAETIDRARLAASGFIDPEAPAGPLAEELRLIKRAVLSTVATSGPGEGQVVLICSSRPDDGKTFTAINLALSIASERDTDVLLVDGDVAKPEILATLGLTGGRGLLDAIADPAVDPQSLIVRTDVRGLSLLSAGLPRHDATEQLASRRMAELLERLREGRPNRVILFDSPPALASSAASALASHAGQVIMVVRADRTAESDLRDACALMSGCRDVRLLLNGATYTSGDKRYSYYGASQ